MAKPYVNCNLNEEVLKKAVQGTQLSQGFFPLYHQGPEALWKQQHFEITSVSSSLFSSIILFFLS